MKAKAIVSIKDLCNYLKGYVRNNSLIEVAFIQSVISGKTMLILFISLVIGNTAYSANPDDYTIVPISALNLNRIATKLTTAQLATYSPAYRGFEWNDDDFSTQLWRPQGITGINVDAKKFILVSWYDRTPLGKGARVSFVNITDTNNIYYRHVLLVDESYNKFSDLHAGGIFVVGDTLYVADSRTGNNNIMKFNMNYIKEVPTEDLTDFENYGYILKRSGSIDVPIIPSTISYDYDKEKMLVGTYNECGSHSAGNPYCSDNSINTAGWFDLNNSENSSPYFSGLFGKMQGMASTTDSDNPARTNVWIATSYSGDDSYLYAINHEFGENTVQGEGANIGLGFNKYILPHGLEGLYVEENGQNLWSLTEFGPLDPAPGQRIVFCMHTADVPPPVHEYSQDILINETQCVHTELEYIARTEYVSYASFVDSDNNWIECNSVVPSLAGKDRSVFAWIKKSTAADETQVIVGINETGGDYNISNLQVGTDGKIGIFDGEDSHWTSINVVDGQWHFVGYTYNNATMETKVYVDQNVGFPFTDAQSFTINDYISLGQEFDDNNSLKGNFFEGYITEVSFWNTVLDVSEIALLRSRTINDLHPKYTNLQAYYPMIVDAEAGSDKVKDYSGKGHNGKASHIDIQAQTDLQQITGYNTADHFEISWLKNSTIISTEGTLSFIAGAASSGTYQLLCSLNDFSVKDEFDLTINTVNVITGLSEYTITANEADASYQWLNCGNNFAAINGETNRSFTATSSGNYSVRITKNACVDTSGCVSVVISCVISTASNPVAGGAISGGGTYNQGATAELIATPASGYDFVNWTEEGIQVSANSTYSFSVSKNRTLVANFQVITQIGNIENSNIIEIFPNPATNRFYLNFKKLSDIDVEQYSIFDILGNKITDERVNLTNGQLEVNCSDIKSGTYLIFIKTNRGIFINKVIIR